MDHTSVRGEGIEVDIESGLVVNDDDDSKNVPTLGTVKQGNTLVAKIYCGLVGKGGDKLNVYYNKSNSNGVSTDVDKVTSKLLGGQDSVDCADKTSVKEKRKTSSHKKAPKPPRPPRAPSLDSADLKLIREISEFAMLKRSRIERMKALKKMRAAKSSSSSSSSSMFAIVFTVVFCILIILQGMSSGKSSVSSFQGSPVSAGGAEGGMNAVQHNLNPFSSDPNAPGLVSHNFVQQITSSDLPEELRRGAR
ncbi:hypothetical protein TanjilG_29149 [Lupinus angustifolius]|uniref:Transmembrane protein n=1 Tax=Lupinus angustifolius TaxID=3871 RepID=A0A1J7GI76_LUPAN|nr:PREDICTED: uncharacterized protein LOC109362138 [Lupinus angustifolius]XP_019463279.1 PREDICTED: uncharacterized protein LOC109362138 [Lupinus angustifolius]XP_019463280.1 PREDICTED: uncharacterized protein LOC109362138 [Lupinus angustifolius]OIW00159.1 hypothetical protein TanjilG_29149 [Lupinus angustifolius]